MSAGRPIDSSEFGALLANYDILAFRLEALQAYNIPDERPLIDLFDRGAEQPEWHRLRPWTEQVRGLIAAGRTMSRVHIVNMPLSSYLEFEINWGYTSNAAAGEQIFLRSDSLGIEAFEDFWLIDDKTVIQMRYAADGSWLGAELIDSPELVLPYREAMHVALDGATPLEQFLTQIS